MSAKTTTLGEHIATQKGFAFKSGWFCDSGRPVVKVKDFTANSVNPNEVTHVSEEIAAQHLKYQLRTGDVVIQTVGSWPSAPASVVGKCVRIPRTVDRALLNQNAVKISPSSNLDGGFLYYSLKNPAFGEYIVGTAQGAASQAAITLEAIRAYKINLPDLPTQRKIAGILSAYDDLIENNLRRIKILEEMAQSLYREWFVHFRFPGHESANFVDSALGQIPKGWNVKKLAEIAGVNAESIRGTNAPDEIRYIDIASVSTGSIDNIEAMSFESAPSRARRVVRHGDIIWSTVRPNRRSFSLIIDPADNLIASTGFAVLSARLVPWSYLYQATITEDFTSYLVNHASGAAYPAVNSGIFENADVIVPPSDLLTRFNAMAEANQVLQHKLHRRNQNLRCTRDLLLPKLLAQ